MLQFNALAIAFAGRACSLRDRREEEDYRRLLELAADESSAAAQGFAVSAQALASVDDRLLRSILRCALQARIYCHRDWDADEDVYAARKAELREEVGTAIQRELDWLAGRSEEPNWPDFPLENPPPKRRRRLPGVGQEPTRAKRRRRDEFLEFQGAAKWLDAVKRAADEAQRSWLRDVIGRYRPWTINANGAELEEDDDVERLPTEWNDAYFGLAAACAPGLTAEQLDEFILDLIVRLSGEAFLGVTARFLRATDVAYLDAGAINPDVATHIRARLNQALREGSAWDRFAHDRSASVEIHIGDAVSAFFFHTYHSGFAPPAPYIFSHQIERMRPLLPVLETLASEAPTLIIASETLTLLEVAPEPEQLSFAIALARAWVAARPDDTVFWANYSVGRRFCTWLEAVRQIDPSTFQREALIRADIDSILSALVRVGVAEAGRLEAQFAADDVKRDAS